VDDNDLIVKMISKPFINASRLGTVLFTLLLLGLFVGPMLAQEQPKKFLLLKRGSKQNSQIRFYPGENITYKSNKIGYFVTDKIVNLDTEYLYLGENILKPSDILAIDIQRKDPRNRTLNNLSQLSLGAGTMIIGLEGVNSLIQQGELEISTGVAKASALLIGTGLALLPFRYKTFTLSEKNRLQLVLLEIE
jgi:hypothetical protein